MRAEWLHHPCLLGGSPTRGQMGKGGDNCGGNRGKLCPARQARSRTLQTARNVRRIKLCGIKGASTDKLRFCVAALHFGTEEMRLPTSTAPAAPVWLREDRGLAVDQRWSSPSGITRASGTTCLNAAKPWGGGGGDSSGLDANYPPPPPGRRPPVWGGGGGLGGRFWEGRWRGGGGAGPPV